MVNKAAVLSGVTAGRVRGALREWLMRAASLSWLTGPIFDKELRVSSRRRRNYVLRFLYVMFFTGLMSLFWVDLVAHRASSVYQISRMATAGRGVVMVVVWFQFLTSQAIALVMLSTSISDEIYHRTLGVLMTTPIGSLQIVLGKLLSRLLQLVLLLAITLPLLATVRVFGGVPWDFLVASLCVTLTTTVFVGSLSLFFSIFTRRAYAVIITTVLAMATLFALLPFIVAFLVHKVVSMGAFFDVLCYVNPYAVMVKASTAMETARSMRFVGWASHGIISLGASGLLLLLSTVLVRKAALRQAAGQSGLWSFGGRHAAMEDSTRTARIRRVTGSPVLWKERSTPLLGRRKLGIILVLLLALGLLVATYIACASGGMLTDPEVHATYIVIFLFLGMLFTAVLPATCVTSEKESQTWPLLMTTALSDWQIVWGKFLGAVRRSAPAWLFLIGHVAVFTLAGIIHPVGAVQLAILVTWVVFFLSGSGLYFSARFRHTTTAVIANVALAVGLWAVVPLLLAIGLGIAGIGSDVLLVYMDMNPVVHAAVITDATAKSGGLTAYNWVEGGISDVGEATGWILLAFVLYVVAGLAFIARAGARIRRNAL
jgi:ABC-type transport system involved in multi-copper enzyme maturation permease subunit